MPISASPLNLKLLEVLSYCTESGEDTMTPEKPPIACTLSPGEYGNRLTSINQLADEALRTCERRDLELRLRYAPEAVERVRELVRREQACCAFLTFELHESPEEIALTIRAPEEARLAANTIFALYVGSRALLDIARSCSNAWRR
jgi:hypothetical protein